MLYALMASDIEGAFDTGLANRPDHLDYLERTGVVRQAGPSLDEDGLPCGSLIVLDVNDMAVARAWPENDPHAKSGLFRDVQTSAWMRVISG